MNQHLFRLLRLRDMYLNLHMAINSQPKTAMVVGTNNLINLKDI
jgi:hypothetical protein